MGKNKKKFIDKKNASTYHLMHRSKRDVAGDEEAGDGMVLWPSPGNKVETDERVLFAGTGSATMKSWRDKLAEAGLLDRSDDQYLKPITGTGTFLNASGKVSDAFGDVRSNTVQEDALIEVDRQFDSIPISQEIMDDDIAEALFGDFEDGDFEALNDDFVLDAAQEPAEVSDEEQFDFDAHIAKLMEKARLQAQGDVGPTPANHIWGKLNDDFFSRAKPLHEINEDESIYGGSIPVTPGVVPALTPDEEKALCEQFEETLAEYDSDELGECYEEEVQGNRPLDGDAMVEAAMDDFLQERDDEVFMQGTNHLSESRLNSGGGGFAVLVGKRMIPSKQIDSVDVEELDEKRNVHDLISDAKDTLARPKLQPPPEEILIDGVSYYSMKERNPWDCESILSTYSNLDNNPVTIGSSRRKKKRRPKNTTNDTDTQPQRITLSNKTGLPIAVTPADPLDEATQTSVNLGQARSKAETSDEKKSRKALVKKERQLARLQKKMMKEVYKDEILKRQVDTIECDVAGVSMYRYS